MEPQPVAITVRWWEKMVIEPFSKEFRKPANAKRFIEELQNKPVVRVIEVTNAAGENMVWQPDSKTRKFGWTTVEA